MQWPGAHRFRRHRRLSDLRAPVGRRAGGFPPGPDVVFFPSPMRGTKQPAGAQHLVKPSPSACKAHRVARSGDEGSRFPDWQVTVVPTEQTTRAKLLDVLHRDKRRPCFLPPATGCVDPTIRSSRRTRARWSAAIGKAPTRNRLCPHTTSPATCWRRTGTQTCWARLPFCSLATARARRRSMTITARRIWTRAR